MEAEWYGFLKTGHADVDRQHEELEAMLQKLIDEEPSAETVNYLSDFKVALQAHFNHEENDIQLADGAHKASHDRILDLLTEGISQVKTNPSAIEAITLEVAWELTKHVASFDAPLEDD